MRATAIAFVLLLPSVCFGQATPGGVYREPGIPETSAYVVEQKERFEVEVWV